MSGHFEIDTIVVGAGAVGLACAAALARTGDDIVLVEADTQIGTGISSRNSEVIHAGLYYPPGSLKADHCITGRALLYEFLAKHQVPHRKCGKLVLASDEAQLPSLQSIAANAEACGVRSVKLLTPEEAGLLESELRCVAALHSSETGVLDSQLYLTALRAEFEALGGVVALGNPITGWRDASDGFVIRLADTARTNINCRRLVLATGLSTIPYIGEVERVGALIKPYEYAKGDYFHYAGPSPFRHHIYPLPVDGGLGVHATIGLDGRLKFGPDVTWLGKGDPSSIDFAVDPDKRDAFADVIRAYWPRIEADRLFADFSGVRPKLNAAGEIAADFSILSSDDHGLENLVYFRGIESPGLTASLSLGQAVAKMLAD